MTEFEMIKQIYIRNATNVHIIEPSVDEMGFPMIEDFENEITLWFHQDGTIDFITNDRETQSW